MNQARGGVTFDRIGITPVIVRVPPDLSRGLNAKEAKLASRGDPGRTGSSQANPTHYLKSLSNNLSLSPVGVLVSIRTEYIGPGQTRGCGSREVRTLACRPTLRRAGSATRRPPSGALCLFHLRAPSNAGKPVDNIGSRRLLVETAESDLGSHTASSPIALSNHSEIAGWGK